MADNPVQVNMKHCKQSSLRSRLLLLQLVKHHSRYHHTTATLSTLHSSSSYLICFSLTRPTSFSPGNSWRSSVKVSFSIERNASVVDSRWARFAIAYRYLCPKNIWTVPPSCLGGAVAGHRTRDQKVSSSTPGQGAIKSTRSTQPSIHPG